MNKVVPFDRDAGYLARKAAGNRREGHPLEALALYRRARERAGNSAACAMEEAETLCEMGCYRQSAAILARLIAGGDAPEDCYFGLCCDYFGQNELEAAYRAMLKYLTKAPEAIERSEVSSMLKNIMLLRALSEAGGRKSARALRLTRHGQRLLEKGDPVGAEAKLRDVIEFRPRTDARTALVRALIEQGRAGEAVRETAALIDDAQTDPDAFLIAVRAREAAGDRPGAQALIERMTRFSDTDEGLRALIEALCLIKADEEMRPLLTAALKDSPFDAALLHVCAVNRARLSRTPEQAEAFWRRILRVDPDNDVARYYLALSARGELPEDLSYAYRLPDAERDARLEKLARLQWADDGQLREPEALELCRWAIRAGDKGAPALGAGLLERAACEQARSLLTEYALRPAAMAREGGDVRWPGDHATHTVVVLEGQGAALTVPPVLRRAMRSAICKARPTLGDISPAVVRIALKRLADSPVKAPIRAASAWAAALIYLSAQSADTPITRKEAARLQKIPLRRLKRAIKAIQNPHASGSR